MTAADRLDAIERRMDREVPALNLHDRDNLRATVAALRAALEFCEGARISGPGGIRAYFADDIEWAITAALGVTS